VFVGNGTPSMARDFRAQFAIRVALYTDPGLEVYAALGLKRGILDLGLLKSTAASARALAAGFVQGRTRGTAEQQGGVFVVGTDGAVRYAFRSTYAGHHPKPDEALAALGG
jgi:hypothetical protein